MSAILPMPALSDIEDAPPHVRSTMNDHETHDPAAPTDHAELRDTMPPEADDADAARAMSTMLPPGTPAAALIDASDSLLGKLIADIAAAARVMVKEREERAQMAAASSTNQAKLIGQQEEIITILRRTEQTGEANYKLLLDAIHRLEKSDSAQDGKIAHHADEIEALRNDVSAFRADVARRLDVLEKKLALEPQRDAAQAADPG